MPSNGHAAGIFDFRLLRCTICRGMYTSLQQVIEVVHPARGVGDPRRRAGEKPKLVIFVHGGAWGSGATW